MLKKNSFLILGILYHCHSFAVEDKIGYEVPSSGITMTGQQDITSDNDTINLYGIYYVNYSEPVVIDANELILNTVNNNTSTTSIPDRAYGIYTYGSTDVSKRPQVNLGNDSQINVKAEMAFGINLVNSNLTGNNLSITSEATAESYGLMTSGTNIDLAGTTNITTNSEAIAVGLYLSSNSTFKSNQVNINVNSNGSSVTQAVNGVHAIGSTVDLGINSNIHVEGKHSNIAGISIRSASVTAKELEIKVETESSNSSGVHLIDGSFTMNGGSISSSGYGISVGTIVPVPPNFTHEIDLKNVTINSKNTAISTSVGSTTLNNVSASSTNNSALRVADDTVQANNVNLKGKNDVISSYESDIILSGYNTISVTNPQSTALNAITATSNSNITTTAGGSVLKIEGNIQSAISTVDLKMNSGSEFIGSTILKPDVGNTAVINLDMTDSIWQMTDNSTLTKLGLNNTTVSFANANYTTLTAAQVSGQGLFKMKTDIAMQQGDLLKVTDTSSGNHHLDIQNKANSQTTGTETLTVVETADGNAAFSLTHQVETGGYKYDLRKASNGTDWELYRAPKNSQSSSAMAGASFLNTSYLLNYVDNQTLLQRLGDLRLAGVNQKQGGFWMKSFGGKLSSFAGANLSGFDMPYWGTQLGIDTTLDNSSGTWLVGGMVGYIRANPNYKEGDGNSKNYSLGLYTTYLHDNGFYVDGLLKYNAINNQFNVKDTANNRVKGKGRTQGVSASLEIGQRIWLTNQHAGFYLEPQAQLTVGGKVVIRLKPIMAWM